MTSLGIATGYATLGLVGFERRTDYAAIGTVTNLAARLCGEAQHGQILVTERVRHFVENLVSVELIGELTLKGFSRPVAAYNIAGLRNLAPSTRSGVSCSLRRRLRATKMPSVPTSPPATGS